MVQKKKSRITRGKITYEEVIAMLKFDLMDTGRQLYDMGQHLDWYRIR